MVVNRFTLDMANHQVQQLITVKAGDTDRQLRMSISNGGEHVDISGYSAVMMIRKSDGSIVYGDVTKDDAFVYSFSVQTANALGMCACELRLYGADGQIASSPRFHLLVTGTVYPDGRVESSDEFSALTRTLNEANGLKDSVGDMKVKGLYMVDGVLYAGYPDGEEDDYVG